MLIYKKIIQATVMACLCLVLTGVSSAFAFLDFGSSKPELVNHRAVYEFDLVEVKDKTSQIADISGFMKFTWDGDCEGWSSTQNYEMRYYFINGQKSKYLSNMASWEARDGSLYRFDMETKPGSSETKVLKGMATRDEDGKVEFSYSEPKDIEVDGIDKVYFPTEHSLMIWDAVEKDKKYISNPFFDGSDEDGPATASVFIFSDTKQADMIKSRAKGNEKIDESLLDSDVRKVRFTFFPSFKEALNSGDVQSTYEMNAIMLKNGVVSKMEIDYHDFILDANLVELEKLPASDENCR
tara:strand:+ start:243 stop:1130 length:888 start_codon:yes stop_codon:yes gene_type:complete